MRFNERIQSRMDNVCLPSHKIIIIKSKKKKPTAATTKQRKEIKETNTTIDFAFNVINKRKHARVTIDRVKFGSNKRKKKTQRRRRKIFSALIINTHYTLSRTVTI